MAIEDDVLVIGGGLAGAVSAFAAKRAAPDARVRLVSYKQSTLRHASGLVDVLGYRPDGEGDGPLVDPFDAIPDCPEGHPYERVGLAGVREALSLFDDAVGDAYLGGHTDRNALVPTHGGTVKPTARYPASAAAGVASDDRDLLYVGFETLSDFEPGYAADHLARTGVPFRTRGVTIPFPGDLPADAKLTRYAHMLDQDETVEAAGGGQVSVRNELAARVADHLDDEARVGFPAMLGDERPDDVRAALEDRLGVPVFEVPMGPPSLPGLRLEDHLFDALEAEGVRASTGNPVVGYETADGSDEERIDHVLLDRNGQEIPYSAEQYVLATGGLVGKGIDTDREGVQEPIFDCHVPHPSDRYEWFAVDAFGDHPFARFGVDVDADLRPRTAGGDPEFTNLRAAGGVLGGYDFAAEKSGGGVSIATGYAAGTAAGEHV